MKPILAVVMTVFSLLAGVAGLAAADGLARPKANRPTLPVPCADCGPRRIFFCTYKESRNVSIHVLRCRTADTASCRLIEDLPLSPAMKVLKIVQMPDGCWKLTVRWSRPPVGR